MLERCIAVTVRILAALVGLMTAHRVGMHYWPAQTRYYEGLGLALIVAAGILTLARIRHVANVEAARQTTLALEANAKAEREAAEKALWAKVNPTSYRVTDRHPERIVPQYENRKLVDDNLGVYPEDDDA